MPSPHPQASADQPSSPPQRRLPAVEHAPKQLRADLRRALVAGLAAVVVLAVGSNLGGLHAAELSLRLIAVGLAVRFPR